MSEGFPLTAAQPRITRILHPTDFSSTSTRALDYADQLALLTGADLCLVHVVVPPEEIQASESALKRAVREAEKRLDSLAKTLKAGPKVRTAARIGSSSTELIRYVQAERIDFVVMGSAGLQGGGAAPMSSVAEKVVRGLTVPVLIVKPLPTAMAPAGRRCTLCGRPAADVLCDACKDRVQGEAVARRRR
jgi:nucleotide-binding universal stress UspA family protein